MKSKLLLLVFILLNSALHAQIFKTPPKAVKVKKITPVKKEKPRVEEHASEQVVTPVKTQPTKAEEPAGVDVVVNIDGQDKTFRMARKYDYIDGYIYEGMIIVEYEGKRGFVNENFQEIVPPKYKSAYPFNEGMAAVCNDEYKWTFIDKKGREIAPFQFDEAIYFFEGLARVEVNGKVKYIDKNGKAAIPFEYSSGGNFCEGLAWVWNNGKLHYIDRSGKEVLTLPYCRAGNFQGGLAAVLKCKDNWGFINKKGEEVIPFRYQEINKGFTNGQAEVVMPHDTVKVGSNEYYLKSEIILIDKSGNKIKQVGYSQSGTKKY